MVGQGSPCVAHLHRRMQSPKNLGAIQNLDQPEGKKIGTVPVKVDPKPMFYVKAKTAHKIGVEVPFEILQAATVVE